MKLTVNGADTGAGGRPDAIGRRRHATFDAQAEWWPAIMADVAAAVAGQSDAVSQDVYDVILREVPQLDDDKPVLALLASSVDSNVDTCLQIMQHRIDLAAVQVPAAAVEYARRLALRGTPPCWSSCRPGSYKATAERLMLHKNTVQYRIRRAEESLGRPVGENRYDVELALRASYWLGPSVLRPVSAGPM